MTRRSSPRCVIFPNMPGPSLITDRRVERGALTALQAADKSKACSDAQYTATLLLPESDPYHPWEARFLSDPGCHPRYMRAAKWKMPDAKNRIKGTLEWRREFKPELIQPGDVSVEAETGKM